MVAERQQLTSLRRPPEGWETSPELRAIRTLDERAKPRSNARPLWEGPRPDADPTHDLQTLTVGVNTLPTSCQNCASRFLHVDPPLGEHRRGMVTCGRCSRQVCWLAALTGYAGVPSASESVAPALDSPREAPPARRLAASQLRHSEPATGCGPTCRRERVIVVGERKGAEWREYHDPAAHDRYLTAVTFALAVMAATRPRAADDVVVRTGALVVDLAMERVLVNGVERRLTPTEWEILAYLSQRLGALCSRESLLAVVWPSNVSRRNLVDKALDGADPYQVLRVHLQRLRPKLGPAGHLIESVTRRGYRLRVEPPIGGEVEP